MLVACHGGAASALTADSRGVTGGGTPRVGISAGTGPWVEEGVLSRSSAQAPHLSSIMRQGPVGGTVADCN